MLILATWVGCVDDTDDRKNDGGSDDDASMDMNTPDEVRSETHSASDINNLFEGGEKPAGIKNPTTIFTRLQNFLGQTKQKKTLEEELMKRLCLDFADSVEGIFSAYDADNSGTIDLEEWTEMVRDLFGNVSRGDTDRLFSSFDLDNGQILKSVFQNKLVSFRDCIDNQNSIKNGVEAGANKNGNNNTSTKSQSSSALIFNKDTSKTVKFTRHLKTLASFYYFLVVPYEICFIYTGKETDALSFLTVSWICDSVLWMNIFVKFHTTYVSRKSVQVTNPLKIRKHYLANGFTCDLIAAFPLDLISRVFINADYTTIRWFRLTRLLTIVEILSYFGNMRQASSQSNRIKAELIIFSFLLFAFTHLPACMWFYLTDNDDEDTFLHNTKIATSEDGYWFSGYGVTSTSGLKFEQYCMSLYWVTGTISTMGQGAGELMPQNAKERIFTIFLMLLNLSAYAYILGAISQLFMTADEALVDIRKEVTLIESYIDNNNFESNLKNEIRSTVKPTSTQMVGGKKSSLAMISPEEERDILRALSHNLRVEISHHTCYHLLKRCGAFEHCNQNFMDSVSTAMEEEMYKPLSYVFKTNEPSNSYFIIGAGTVNLLTDFSEDAEQDENGEVAAGKKRKSGGRGGGEGKSAGGGGEGGSGRAGCKGTNRRGGDGRDSVLFRHASYFYCSRLGKVVCQVVGAK